MAQIFIEHPSLALATLQFLVPHNRSMNGLHTRRISLHSPPHLPLDALRKRSKLTKRIPNASVRPAYNALLGHIEQMGLSASPARFVTSQLDLRPCTLDKAQMTASSPPLLSTIGLLFRRYAHARA